MTPVRKLRNLQDEAANRRLIAVAPVAALVSGNNADLIAQVAHLYARPGSRIADVTYGKGVFWRKVDTGLYDLYASDLQPNPKADRVVVAADYRALLYGDASFDVVVLDPPYSHESGARANFEVNYQNSTSALGKRAPNHSGIMQDYYEGMREAHRVLREGGTLWVKSQDEIESGIQRWAHCTLWLMAITLGLYPRDRFVLGRPEPTKHRNGARRHLHAARNLSDLWIFEKSHEKLKKTQSDWLPHVITVLAKSHLADLVRVLDTDERVEMRRLLDQHSA